MTTFQQTQNWQSQAFNHDAPPGLGVAGLISVCGVFSRKRSKASDSVVSYIESLLVMDAIGLAASKMHPFKDKRAKLKKAAQPSKPSLNLFNHPRFNSQPILEVAWWAFLSPVKPPAPCGYDQRPITGPCQSCNSTHSPILQMEPLSLDDEWIISEA
ncbi:hypothetical protein DSO57_1036058 [Entomophthora muscae]|uniref:Uncharacterized protein n=1 Tax=Entomophthora muscae TaxID=34485 RepID=A0ACC2TXH2_9FUNG|nr:hypothetical protein DSO57_1036058 [Entomophthora muscae]